MAKVKQVIIIRKDLKMPVGKLAAQVSHASTGAFLKHFTNTNGVLKPNDKDSYRVNVEPWLTGEFTKICLKVDSLEELLEIHAKCIEAKIPVALIKDAAHTVFDQPTLTCLGVGPFRTDIIDNITNKLKLYR